MSAVSARVRAAEKSVGLRQSAQFSHLWLGRRQVWGNREILNFEGKWGVKSLQKKGGKGERKKGRKEKERGEREGKREKKRKEREGEKRRKWQSASTGNDRTAKMKQWRCNHCLIWCKKGNISMQTEDKVRRK